MGKGVMSCLCLCLWWCKSEKVVCTGFEQPAAAQQRGALQLLDSLDRREGAGPPTATAMPSGFLEDFAQRFEQEGLETVIEPIGAPYSESADEAGN